LIPSRGLNFVTDLDLQSFTQANLKTLKGILEHQIFLYATNMISQKGVNKTYDFCE